MHVSHNVADLQDRLADSFRLGHTIGFIPTMGALHEGHLSLVEKARAECQKVVVSVFVNPTQFNDPNDLTNYPRNEESDLILLRNSNCDSVFMPTVEQVYPSNTTQKFALDGLDSYMEGALRPGHFNGVVQVVDRLLSIIKPTKAYFGEKDYQQLAIIRHTMPRLGHKTQIIGCSTLREDSGLARSSRNELLSTVARTKAKCIFQELSRAKRCFLTEPSNRNIELEAIKAIEAAGLEPEYFSIADPESLQPKSDSEKGSAIACVAARIDGVRLIDNLMLFG
jgi:pantoate--beta-alanine ligase